MSVRRRAAVVCGIAGGVWALLAPILMLLPIYVRVTVDPATSEVSGEEVTNMVQAGAAGDVWPVFTVISLLGVLGLLAMALRQRNPLLSRALLWTSAVALLMLSLASIFSIGLLFLPASVLLLVAAFLLRGQPKSGKRRLAAESRPLARQG